MEFSSSTFTGCRFVYCFQCFQRCWFLLRAENRRAQRKSLGVRTRANNKINPYPGADHCIPISWCHLHFLEVEKLNFASSYYFGLIFFWWGGGRKAGGGV